MNNLTELEGQITRLMWRNPHVQFTMLDANDELWDIETNSVSILSRMNVSSDLLAEGDRVPWPDILPAVAPMKCGSTIFY